MRIRRDATLGALVAVTVVGAIVGLSHVPWGSGPEGSALLRLAWRTRGVRVEECRHLAPEELARLPAHMRREEVCDGRVLPHILTLSIDGVTVLRDSVHGAGARGDRPLYVNAEHRLAPGTHVVAIRFVRDPMPDPEAEARAPTPRLLAWRGRVTLAPGEVALITWDPDAARLVARGAGTIVSEPSSAVPDSLDDPR